MGNGSNNSDSVRGETIKGATIKGAGGGGVALAFSGEGLSSISLGGLVVARGDLGVECVAGVWDAGETFDSKVGKLVRKEMAALSGTACRVTATYEQAQLTCLYTVAGEDVSIEIRLEHLGNSGPLPAPAFKGLTFLWSSPPASNMPTWNWTYLQHMGAEALMHPSVPVPIGAGYVADSNYGLAVHTVRHFDRKKLFMWDSDSGPLGTSAPLAYCTRERLEPGEVRRYDIQLRISTSTDWRHLLEPYRVLFQSRTGGCQYTPDHRPVAQFSSADKSWARADNPWGFNDNGGSTIARRLDLGKGCDAFASGNLVQMAGYGGQGCIFWVLGGAHPRGAMYRPDFDVLPPAIEANIPRLTAAAAKLSGSPQLPIRLGLCARPGEFVTPITYATDGTFRLSPASASQMDMIRQRFARARALGFSLYYLDTFGSSGDDAAIMKIVRSVIGPDAPSFCEYACDLILPYAGRYVEWNGPGGGYSFADQWTLDCYRFLVPETVILVKRNQPMAYDEMGRRQLTPLMFDFPSADEAKAAQAFTAQYLTGRAWANARPTSA